MWPFSKKKEVFWERRFSELAEYNSEIGRGIIHTQEFCDRMKTLQKEYNKKSIRFYSEIK